MPNVYSFKTCINCGTTKRSNGKKYCSPQCQHDYQIKEKVKNWLDGKHSGIRGKTQTAPWIKKYLIKIRGHMCENCKNSMWMEKLIPIELEHIDGNFLNNKIDNLKLLCCNCHAQTLTYKGANKVIGRPRAKYYRGL